MGVQVKCGCELGVSEMSVSLGVQVKCECEIVCESTKILRKSIAHLDKSITLAVPFNREPINCY